MGGSKEYGMKLVRRRGQDDSGQPVYEVIRSLNSREIRALSDHVGLRARLDSETIRIADDIHRRAWSEDHWFECFCNGVAEPQAILIPVRPINAEPHFRLHVESQIHAAGCPFDRGGSTYETYRKALKAPKVGERFTFLTRSSGSAVRMPGHAERDAISQSVRGGGRTRPTLARLLFALISSAGLNRFSDTGGGQRWMSAVRQAANDFEICKDRPLNHYLALTVDEVSNVREKLRRTRRHWPSHVLPHGIAVLVFDESRDGVLFANGKPILKVGCHVPVFGETEAKVRSPYWFIGVFNADRDNFDLAYAHPTTRSPHRCPVDSNYERMTLQRLLELQKSVGSSDLAFEIEKPLFDLTDNSDVLTSAPFRPDFVLRLNTRLNRVAVVVETMGYDTEAYRATKALTHRRMRNYAAVVEHKCYFSSAGFQKVDELMITEVRNALAAATQQ